MSWKLKAADIGRYREAIAEKGPVHKVALAFYESLTRQEPGKAHVSAWWGEGLIVLGGLLAYFFNPAWLALSILGLSWVLGSVDTHTRGCVVALVSSLEELSRQIEELKREP